MIDPGKLRERITIQARSTTRDAQGSTVDSWADGQTIWAELVRTTGAQGQKGGAARTQRRTVFRIRFLASLTEQHRIIFKGEKYDIIEIAEETDGRPRTSQLIYTTFAEGAPA